MNGSIATRYARALFLEALEQGVDKAVYDHLGLLYYCLKETPELQNAITTPKVQDDRKLELLITASNAVDAPQLFKRFLQLVLLHNRESHLKTMVLIYQTLYREHYHIDKVIFETAVQPSDANIEKMKASVKARTGREVECTTQVRPELIGGFRLRIGDKRYDYSYATKLDKIKKIIGH